jgi:quercetin dioxygenase-like cupin family protein
VSQETTAFTAINRIPVRQVLGTTIRGRYAHGDRCTVGDVELDADTVIPIHEHPHEQITYLLEGSMHFVVGDETMTMKPGDIAVIPGGVSHGGRTISRCRVIDAFAPARDDYRENPSRP